MNYKICIIGVKDTTIQLAKFLIERVTDINCIITIDKDKVNSKDISGFSSPSDFAKERLIPLYEASSYSLKSDDDRRFFHENTFDLGICMGWQRLIPEDVLGRFKFGVFGFHGSCGYLPYGRGRSPLNWSIINGDRRFILNMFRYDKYPDSPNVYKNRIFQITPFDTIRTLQYKNLLVSYELSQDLIHDYMSGEIKINSNSKDFNSIYPKRTKEDGKISFEQKTKDIYNLVRGVSAPFPGAFCFHKASGSKITLWRCVPFDEILDFSSYEPGEIVEIFDGMPVVRTLDGSILMQEFESEGELKRGDVLC